MLCQFYLRGNCKFGDECRRLHDDEAVAQQHVVAVVDVVAVESPPASGVESPSARRLCAFYLRGECKFGNGCKFLHANGANHEEQKRDRATKKREWEERRAERERKQQEWEERQRLKAERSAERERKQQEWEERQRAREEREAEREARQEEWEERQRVKAEKNVEHEAKQQEWEQRKQRLKDERNAERQAEYEERQRQHRIHQERWLAGQAERDRKEEEHRERQRQWEASKSEREERHRQNQIDFANRVTRWEEKGCTVTLFKGGGLHVDSNRRIHKDVSLSAWKTLTNCQFPRNVRKAKEIM